MQTRYSDLMNSKTQLSSKLISSEEEKLQVNTSVPNLKYHKILIGLGELIFGRTYYWREVCISKWIGLDNKSSLRHKDTGCNSQKQLTLTVHRLTFRRAYYWKDICVYDCGGLCSGGLIFGGAYYRNFTVTSKTE